jgi:hypothetical protein
MSVKSSQKHNLGAKAMPNKPKSDYSVYINGNLLLAG